MLKGIESLGVLLEGSEYSTGLSTGFVDKKHKRLKYQGIVRADGFIRSKLLHCENT